MKILKRGCTPEEQEAFWAKGECRRCKTVFACQRKERYGSAPSHLHATVPLYFRCPLCEHKVTIDEDKFSPEEPSDV